MQEPWCYFEGNSSILPRLGSFYHGASAVSIAAQAQFASLSFQLPTLFSIVCVKGLLRRVAEHLAAFAILDYSP